MLMETLCGVLGTNKNRMNNTVPVVEFLDNKHKVHIESHCGFPMEMKTV